MHLFLQRSNILLSTLEDSEQYPKRKLSLNIYLNNKIYATFKLKEQNVLALFECISWGPGIVDNMQICQTFICVPRQSVNKQILQAFICYLVILTVILLREVRTKQIG